MRSFDIFAGVRHTRTLAPSLLAAGSLLCCASLARAEQVTVTNVSYTHSAETTSDSHYRVAPIAGSPSNWKAPVDYSQGSVHVLLEVKTKPTAKDTKFQICFEGTPSYACTNQSVTYKTTGKYEWDTKFEDMWSPDDKPPVDWTKGVSKVALILKDTNNGKPQGNAEYVPTDLHVEVTLVTAGATFAPPSGGGAPIAPPLDAGTLRPARPDAGQTTTDASTTPVPAVDAGTAVRDAGRDAARSPIGPAPGDDDDIGDDDDDVRSDASTSIGKSDAGPKKSDEDSGGCNVGAASASGGLPFGFTLLMLAARVRRRRRSTF